MLFYYYSQNTFKSFRVEWKSKTSSASDTIVTKITSFDTTKYAHYQYKKNTIYIYIKVYFAHLSQAYFCGTKTNSADSYHMP